MTVAIILAGGYAKRMWPLTKNVAKALLPINGHPNIHHIIRKLEKLPINKIIISTNEKFAEDFQRYVSKHDFTKEITIIVEPTTNEDEKLGAVRGLQYTIKQLNIEEDILLVLGDNNFEDTLTQMITPQQITIATTQVTPTQATQLGIVTVTPNNTVKNIQEKPENPKSNTASTGIYYLPQKTHKHIKQCKNKDNIGNMIKHLHKYQTIHNYTLHGKWKDIGTTITYTRSIGKTKINDF